MMFQYLLVIAAGFLSKNVQCRETLLTRFSNWVTEYKIDIDDESHFLSMYETWKSNDDFIETSNQRNLTYVLGHSRFSGMSSEEFSNYLGFVRLDYIKPTNVQTQVVTDSTPASIEWTKLGGVTKVKDQGQCGSCWSFSTTGALEGAYFNKYGVLDSFSEQQLVDCDNYKNGGRDMGCNGGLMDHAFAWIEKNNGLCLEQDYQYVSGETKTAGSCQKTCAINSKSKTSGFVDVEPSSDAAMKQALAKQPVSIAIEADQREFQLYKSGVFTAACGTKLDHGVLAVGYGADYYLVKNSWGESWGDGGYIKLGMGDEFNNGDGQCGMLLQGSYPLL